MHLKEAITVCVLVGIGGVLFIFGTFVFFIWPEIFSNILAQELRLTPKSKSYEAWKQPPISLSLDIYLYNWTNPEYFVNGTEKPHFQQLGPYRFIEKPDKVNITWNSHNSTVTYRKLSQYFFDEQGSNGTLDDLITSINVVSLSAAEKGRFSDYVRAKSIALGLSLYNQKITVTKTAGELLFEGYEDDMVSLAKTLPFLAGEEIPFDRVGWFYMRNNTADLTGWYNVDTGEKNIKDIGTLRNWNFAGTNGAFKEECGKISGSAGEFFPPKQEKGGVISIFTPDMCRSLPLEYETDVKIQGITGYKYIGGKRSVDNGLRYSENSCFSPGLIVPSGTINISSCRYGTPVFMSYPHFYNADPYYLTLVDGMIPLEKLHQMYIVIEPTGLVIDVAARLQLNLLVRENPNIPMYNDLPYAFVPILWFEQRVTISEEIASEIILVLSIPYTGRICGVIIAIIGLVMLLWKLVDKLFCKRYIKANITQKSNVVKEKSCENIWQDANIAKVPPSTEVQKKYVAMASCQKFNISMDKIPYIDASEEKLGH